MAVRNNRRLPSSRKRIWGALTLCGTEYPFELRSQIVKLGPAGPIQYYYMLPADLRGKDPRQEISNFRSCVGFWWAAMHRSGLQNGWDQQRHYVMAICYALVNRNKSLQDVYLDGLPRPDTIDPESLSVPDETRERMRDIINRRDCAGVKEELDRALAIYHPSREDAVGFTKAFQTWADKGVNAYRRSGQEGVIGWLAEVDSVDAEIPKALLTASTGLRQLFQLSGEGQFLRLLCEFLGRPCLLASGASRPK